MRKGQVTLFIIIGIVLLITVSMFLLIKPKNPDPNTLTSDDDKNRLEYALANCLQDALDESIYYAAATTFFTEESNLRLNNAPLFHIEGVETFPGEKEIASRYSTYLETELATCMNTENVALNQELILDEKPYEVLVIFAEDEIKANCEMKGKLSNSKSSRILEKVSASTITALAPLYGATRMVTTSTIENPFCPECLNTFALQKDIYGVATYGPTEGTIEFTFVDFEEQLEINFLVAP
jgi:hypothetical protein